MTPPLVLAALLALGPTPASAAPSREALRQAQDRYLKGILLERRGELAAALDVYEEALAFDPESAFIMREAAELALEANALERAKRWAERLAALDADDAEARVLLGRVHWALGRVDEAQADFETALRLDPASAESIFSLGTLLAAKAPDKARQLLERFLRQNPEEAADVHFHLAKLELQAGRAARAREHLERSIALSSDSDSLPARYALAQSYEAGHSTAAALAEYLKIMKIEPHNVALLNHLGQLHFFLGQWDELRAVLERAVSLEPGDPTASHWLALEAERRGDFAAAAGRLRASSALKDEPSLSMRLSYYLTQAGRLQEAVKVLEAAHQRWSDNDQVAYFLALGYDDLKEDDRAIRVLRRVVALKPEWRDARYQLAVLLERRGRMGEAEAEFRALLAQRADDAQILNYLGYSLADRGLKLVEAEALIRRAVAMDPRNGAYWDSLGWAHYKQGRSTEAVAELGRALELLPEDETVWDHLGDAALAAGRREEAWLLWRRARALQEGGATSADKAARLESRLSPEVLGRRTQEYLRLVHGGIRRVGALCELEGEVLGRSFSFDCLLAFRGPDELDVDVLGPLFTPLFRMRLNGQGFVADPLRLEGVSPEAALQAAEASVRALRDLLSGRIFELAPATLRRGWRRREVLAQGWRLRLDRGARLLEEVVSPSEPQPRLELGAFDRIQGRQVPRRVSVHGRGYRFSFRLDDLKIEFGAAPAFKP